MNPPHSTARPHVYMDIGSGGKLFGRLVIELFTDIVPKTAKNFKEICCGTAVDPKTKKPLSFEGNIFHRVIPGFVAQGGDITRKDGTGGMSIYGPAFVDENFSLRHSEIGILSMANSGPNTNASQFFITLAPTPHLDGKHVVFGRVASGKEILRNFAQVRTDATDRPLTAVSIVKCGDIRVLTEEEEKLEKEKKEEEKKTAREQAIEEARKREEKDRQTVQSVQEGVMEALKMRKRKESEPSSSSSSAGGGGGGSKANESNVLGSKAPRKIMSALLSDSEDSGDDDDEKDD